MSKTKKLERIAYEKYQLDWLKNHNFSIKDLLQEIETIPFSREVNIVEDKLAAFEEIGFNGELYVCFNEFLDNEFQDKDYMKFLLTKEEFEEYLKIQKGEEK